MEKKENVNHSLQEIRAKMEYYCAYQERCYKEVEEKLFSYHLPLGEKEIILIYLIENNYINEERFAKSFTRGKHNYKNWGKNRIKNELKFRNISSKIIEIALQEIENKTYLENFNSLAEKNWNTIKEKKGPKKNKKFIDFLLRKGYETHLIYDKLNELEKEQ
ncbi:regulatory protein RecX [Flavobacterium sp. HNIBRBA15423]|uniref:regulatory protein RecX n=1 Tax=Flavobacterium sp. HNIBRBA15423 TaxID=3458683 RepID=UPI0040446875